MGGMSKCGGMGRHGCAAREEGPVTGEDSMREVSDASSSKSAGLDPSGVDALSVPTKSCVNLNQAANSSWDAKMLPTKVSIAFGSHIQINEGLAKFLKICIAMMTDGQEGGRECAHVERVFRD